MTTESRNSIPPLARFGKAFAAPRFRFGLAVLGLAVILFGLLGYLWLPGFAKVRIEALASAALQRPVSVQAIAIQPYALTATVRGLTVGARADASTGASPLLEFDELFVNLSGSSLLHRAPVISELRLRSPRLHLERDAAGRYSVTDLVETWMGQPANGDAARFSVANIVVEGGSVEFDDRLKGKRHKLGDMHLGIPILSNFDGEQPIWVEPRFSARINDAAFELSGKALPFAGTRQAALAIRVEDFDLTRIDEYSPVPLAARLQSARLDTDLTLAFEQPAGKVPRLSLAGDIVLRQVDLAAAGGDGKASRTLLRLPRLALKLGAADSNGRVAIDTLQVDAPEVALRRSRDGRIDWQGLLASPKPQAAPSPVAAAGAQMAVEKGTAVAPMQFSMRSLKVDKAKLKFDDDAAETPFALAIASLDFKLEGLDLAGKSPALGTLGLAGITLSRRGDKAPPVSIEQLDVAASSFDPGARRMQVGDVSIAGLRVATRRDRDGRLDLQKLLPQAGAPPVAAKRPATAVAAQVPAQAPWQIEFGKLALADSSLRFEDSTLASPLPFVVDQLNLSVEGLDPSGSRPARLAIAAQVNKRGSVRAAGTLGWAPFFSQLDLDLKDVDLVPLQGWAGERLNALVTRGALSFHGAVRGEGMPLRVALRGEGRLSNFSVLDKLNATDLLRWRTLDIGGIDLTTQPLKVGIESIALSEFFARIIISADGKLNLKDLVRRDEVENGSPATSTAAVPATTAAVVSPDPAAVAGVASATAPMPVPTPVRIGRITLQGGNVNFSDRFIKPNYSANLTALAGRIGPLNPGTPGDVEIRGSVDRSAPLEILGKVDPFASELALDIQARAKGIDLPTFSPYSGKYVGYAIEKGKLSVDVKYRVDKGLLTAENNIFLDQLSFGAKIDSPDALSIPVNLAVALLKNSRGEIDINLPISGSLNDPQFSLGGIIVKVIVNLIVKAVTSPFALLGSLFGGGEELSMLEFAPGRATLDAASEKRLQSLAKALAERPGLKLEISGRADPENDREGLKRAVLERRVKAQKLAEGAKRGESGGSVREVEVGLDEYPKYLELAYKDEKFPKPKNMIGFTKSLPVPEMEQLMLANINAGDDEMRQLADRRARAARDWLVGKGSIAVERVFVLAPKVEGGGDGRKLGSRAEFSLK